MIVWQISKADGAVPGRSEGRTWLMKYIDLTVTASSGRVMTSTVCSFLTRIPKTAITSMLGIKYDSYHEYMTLLF